MKAESKAIAGGDRLPSDIHAGLVDTLFGTVASFLSGIFGGLLVPVVAWLRTRQVAYLVCAAVIIVLAVFRIALLLAYHRAPPDQRAARAAWWERWYAVGGIGFMTAVGVSSALLFLTQDDELLWIYGVVIVLGCAGSLAGRNAGRPAIVMGQMLGVALPVVLVLLTRFDAWYWGLSFIFLLVLTSVRSTTHFLNRMLVTALLSSREARQQGRVLGSALNSMSHGLCMVDHDGRLTVANRRLLDSFGMEAAAPETLEQLGGAITRWAACDAADADAFMRTLRAHVDKREPGNFTQILGSKIFLFRFEAMEAGGSVIVIEDITEARRSAEQVERLAHFDPLTGLANRFELLHQLRSHLDRTPAANAVLLTVDLDRFKNVNDTLGHTTGDRLLQQVAERLQEFACRSDLVARFGGDEFQLLLRTRPAQADIEALAAALVARVSEPYRIERHSVSVGASVGIAIAPQDATDADALLRCADLALYSAKGASRGTYRSFHPELDAEAHRKRHVEIELRLALQAGCLEVHYQPTVDVRAGRVVAVEALVRWRHPSRGLISPAEFIPIAEETGLIAEIGEYVLRQACVDAMSWPSDIRVAVNVSPMQFLLQQDLLARVETALRRSGLPPQRLELEITESTLMDSNDMLVALAQAGIRISLDDFGTGYSSLAYLRRFKIDKIKIDRSFVSSEDPVSLAIIEAVSFLAETLKVDLVAEGVETRHQLDLLEKRNVALIQGYLFSKPVPVDQLREFLDTFPDVRQVA